MNVDDSFFYCVDIIECVCYGRNIIESVFYYIDIFEDIFHYMVCDMYCFNNIHIYHCFFDLDKVNTK